MKKLWIGILIIAVLTLATVLIITQSKKELGEIKIGAILPLTGEAAKFGQSAKEGIDLAIEEINTAGGINQRKIVLIYEDSKADPKTGTNAIQRLINIEKVPAIIGPMASSVTLAIAPIAEKNNVIVLSPASSAPQITVAGDYIFRNTYSDIYEGQKMARYIYEQTKYRKIGIMYINNDYGIGLKDVFKNKFTELGGQVIASETYDFGSTDFRTQLSKLKNANLEAVYLIGYEEMGRILVQAKELGIKVPFFSCIMFENPNILKIAGKQANGVIYTFPSYNPESEEREVVQFIQTFENKYSHKPDGFAANSYDAAKILAYSIEKSGTKSSQIKSFLYTIENYPGVTGKTSFDENGDVLKPIGIKQVEDGEFTWLKFTYWLGGK